MQMEEDFVPDFSIQTVTGSICNISSQIQCTGGFCYVSLDNKLNKWSMNATELLESYGTRKPRISAFVVDSSRVVMGYDDGAVEIIGNDESKVVRMHGKRITQILLLGEKFVSSSMDGSICCYDLVLDDVVRRFEGNKSPVVDLVLVDSHSFCAVCKDGCIKIWTEEDEVLQDVIAFDGEIAKTVVQGEEALVFHSTGDSVIVNLKTKKKVPFEKFKKLRNVVLKDKIMGVQMQKKMAIFECTGVNVFGFKQQRRFESSSEFFNFDLVGGEPCFISKQNRIVSGPETLDFGFHWNEIVDIVVDGPCVYSISEDRIVCWTEDLNVSKTLKLRGANCLALFSGQLLVGTGSGVVVVDRDMFEVIQEIPTGRVSSLAHTGTVLAVCVDSTVTFMDGALHAIKLLELPQNVVYSLFSDYHFFCSCLDNKIYSFCYETLEQKTVLYGHSLPVRQFALSADGKLLLSCGADKLVKLWGLEFGECRKTFISDSHCGRFVSNLLFMFSSKELEYYNYFNRLRKFRIFNPRAIAIGKDFIVVSSGKGLVKLTMNQYEFMKEDESSELEQAAIKGIAHVRDYDTFLDNLERLESDFTDTNSLQFFEFLEKLDFNELQEYLYSLDDAAVKLLLRVMAACVEKNAVVNARMFVCLMRSHATAARESSEFLRLKCRLQEKVKGMRDLYNRNLAEIIIDLNKDVLD